MSSNVQISLIYKNEIKFILSNALKVLTIQVLFSISTSNIFLQDAYGMNYFPTSQGEFIDVNKDILIIRPSLDQIKLQTIVISCSDSRFLLSNGDFIYDSLSVGYTVNSKSMRNTLIKFDDLASLNDKKIVKAFVGLHGLTHPDFFTIAPREIIVYRVDQNYGKIKKWSEMPLYNPVPITSIMVGETSGEVYYWDITLLVKSWIDGTNANYGIILKPKDSFGMESCKDFFLSAKPPHLKVIYSTI